MNKLGQYENNIPFICELNPKNYWSVQLWLVLSLVSLEINIWVLISFLELTSKCSGEMSQIDFRYVAFDLDFKRFKQPKEFSWLRICNLIHVITSVSFFAMNCLQCEWLLERSHALNLNHWKCIYVNILPAPCGAEKSIWLLIGPVSNSGKPYILIDACFVVKCSL